VENTQQIIPWEGIAWGLEPCPVCGGKAKRYESSNALNSLYFVGCPRCGDYEITDTAVDFGPIPFVREHMYLVSAITRQFNEVHGKCFRINSGILTDEDEFRAQILSLTPSGVQEKLDHLLQHFGRKSTAPGSEVSVDLANDYPLAFCSGPEELLLYLDFLDQSGLVPRRHPSSFIVSVEGWRKIEETAKPNLDSKQAFVAMWFDEQMNEVFTKGIKPLEDDTGFKMLRIDTKEFLGDICDEIIVEIRKSRFVIADVTGQRQGVYFEAGYAMGLGLPVIWTVREDQIKECKFNTRQYNHVRWESPEDLREKLKNRILATIQ